MDALAFYELFAISSQRVDIRLRERSASRGWAEIGGACCSLGSLDTCNFWERQAPATTSGMAAV